MKSQVLLFICALLLFVEAFSFNLRADSTQPIAIFTMNPLFEYYKLPGTVPLRWAYLDSTYVFSVYADGTVLAGPESSRFTTHLLSPQASVFVPDTDTLLALDCGSLWIMPLNTTGSRTRIPITLGSADRVRAIDHGFVRRVGNRIYIHHDYSASPTDSAEHPSSNDYWSVSFNSERSASWGWGPSTAHIQWSLGDTSSVELPLNSLPSCSVLSDSVLAIWNTNLMVSRNRGETWHHYRTKDIDPLLPEEDITYQSFRGIEIRGTDIYVSFIPERRSDVLYYVSSDLGKTWLSYIPAKPPVHEGALQYRVGISSPSTAHGIRFVPDGQGVRIVELQADITQHRVNDPLSGYGVSNARYSTVDTVYSWDHSINDCSVFDPGVTSSSWVWLTTGFALVKSAGSATYSERRTPVEDFQFCWTMDSSSAVVKLLGTSYITYDDGVTWKNEKRYDSLLAVSSPLNGKVLTLWDAEDKLELRSSENISDNGILLGSVPFDVASHYYVNWSGDNGCSINTRGGKEWGSIIIKDLSNTMDHQSTNDGRLLFFDSLTSRDIGVNPEPFENHIARVYEDYGRVFGVSVNHKIGLKTYAWLVDVAEERPQQQVRVWISPTPARDHVRIETANVEISSIRIYSATGSLVLSQTVQGLGQTISTSALAPGAYAVVVTLAHTMEPVTATMVICH